MSAIKLPGIHISYGLLHEHEGKLVDLEPVDEIEISAPDGKPGLGMGRRLYQCPRCRIQIWFVVTT